MIIFLHGFNSAGFGQKFRKLSEIFHGEIVLAPTYPAHHPSHAIRDISRSLATLLNNYPDDKPMLVGSSMGGFYSLWLAQQFGLKCVLINPALDPLTTLAKHVGPQQNFYTAQRYTLTQDMVNETQACYIDKTLITVPYLALIDKGDEIIDYHTTIERLPNSSQIVLFEGGDHRFQHLSEASQSLLNFYSS